ncbi:hypothetical protein ATY41_05780 [Leifsonia xyli subsp. xyli]|uniref:Uncharacterized protein n=2 Tax=Leifsonia xyli subsp. xyli TaxID=59736 RepID=Q6AER2_LEIXX|nr:hypothetical protein [Leifsonia xyli]AAT89133.1 hypothetical protein Lxx12950 [Leifsonia xyli subsp. xyli str. CTCB07]ODA89418.1 hypothetical protein ATY41_05780 [Leifsonia xyli subsp. xyli]
MFLFKNELNILTQAVRDGRSAQILATSGMGASTVLSRLVKQLEAEGYAVIRFNGRSYAVDIDFFPFYEAGIFPGTPNATRNATRTVGGIIDVISDDLIAHQRRVVVLDGIDFMDGPTLSVLQAVLQRTATPTVFSQSRGFHALKSAKINYTLHPGLRVELRPINYAATVLLVQESLGGAPSLEIISQIYTKSGGITGLILALSNGARLAELITLSNGRWSMRASNLWSPLAEAWLESAMTPLGLNELEALEDLAFAHRSGKKACALPPLPILRQLKAMGFLTVYGMRETAAYGLQPPALYDYFGSTAGESARIEKGEPVSPAGALGAFDSVFSSVQAHRNNMQRAALATQLDWQREPTVTRALDYLGVLMRSPTSDHVIRGVFEQTQLETAVDAAEAFDYEFLRMTWAQTVRYECPSVAAEGPDLANFLSLYTEWTETLRIFFELIMVGPQPVTDRFERVTSRPSRYQGLIC